MTVRRMSDPLRFLGAGGTMGALMRAHDWAATPLGSPRTWPTGLSTLVGVMLGSSQAMFVAWGADRILLYNDSYAELLGRKHPAALGRPLLQVWSEVQDDLKPLVDQVYAGGSVHMDDITLVMERHGHWEEAHFAFSYSPVRDETGEIAGLFCTTRETTTQVFAERRALVERKGNSFCFSRCRASWGSSTDRTTSTNSSTTPM